MELFDLYDENRVKTGKTIEILPWLREFEGRRNGVVPGTTRVAWDIPPSLWCNEMRFYTLDKWQEVSWMAEIPC